MTGYLYILGIGPVQDFIAAARRTRDLWFGSFLLSEISKAAARTVAENGGRLIFPALEKGDQRLEPAQTIDGFNVANIILAEVYDKKDLEILHQKAVQSAQEMWLSFARRVKEQAQSIINMDIWNDQIEDVIECYAAWVPYETSEHYKEARQELMRLYGGRKMLRDFKSPIHSYPGVNKSSLDGARESVLMKDVIIPKRLTYRLRLSKGEELCAVGLVKRLGGWSTENIPFPSISRITIDPWIRKVQRAGEDAKALLKEIGRLCEGENGYSSGTGDMYYSEFPYDGQFFFPDRLMRIESNIQQISEDNPDDPRAAEDIRNFLEIKKLVRRLQKSGKEGLSMGEPDPYFAILVADGDRIGAAISWMDTPNMHRAFSERLAGFASRAREIIMKNNGCLVYSGGDDVLALLPVDSCLPVARALHDTFEDEIRGGGIYGDASPTLSVGIAICHSLEPLEDIRIYGKIAEMKAKDPDRNGLCVYLYKRSGGDPVMVREQWKKKGCLGLDERLCRFADMFHHEMFPDKAAYDVRSAAQIYMNWNVVSQDLLIRDLERLLNKKRSGRGIRQVHEEDIAFLKKVVREKGCLEGLADELILARKIADHHYGAPFWSGKVGV